MTDTELAVRDGSLAIRDQDFWTREQRAALATLGIRNASNADLAVFLHYCQKTQLDPFARQIYGIMRREKIGDDWVDKFTIQVGIDGFRVIRDRVAARLGVTVEYEDTVWYDGDGSEHTVWLRDDPPVACKVVVLKNGRRYPAVVRTASYIATKDGRPVKQWRTQPDHMIEKCAEAFALRRAFPNDLGGLYVPEELPPEPPRDIPRLADGRLDQTQMTESEKWDTGNMDRHARVEHTELRRAASERGPGAYEYEQPATPAEPAETPSGPETGADKKPSNAATGRLQRLLREIPLGSDEDVAALLHWLTGQPLDAELTAHGVKVVTSYLGDLLEATDDPEKAAEQAWEQYRAAQVLAETETGHG
jgi:phage recombination protein Bet